MQLYLQDETFTQHTELLRILYLTNKEASTVLCSVGKHAGSGRARKKCRGKHETKSSVFPHFLSALPLPKDTKVSVPDLKNSIEAD